MGLLIGDAVQVVFSDDWGFIRSWIDGETVEVEIQGKLVAHFTDHLEALSPKQVLEFQTSGKLNSTEANVELPKEFEEGYPAHLDKGLWLFLEKVEIEEKEDPYYPMYFFNKTPVDLSIEYRFYLANSVEETLHFKLKSNCHYELHDLLWDDFPSLPRLEFNFKVGSNYQGRAKEFQKIVKPKARWLLAEKVKWDELENEGFVNCLLPSIPLKEVKQKERTNSRFSSKGKRPMRKYHQEVFLHVEERVIDLHLEKLLDKPKQMGPKEILYLQMTALKASLIEAIKRQEPSMVIIHGLGKGVLKTEVGILLSSYKEVRIFKNDYDPKYGFGATFVEFKYSK